MDSIILDLTILNSGILDLTGDILNNISITNSEVTLIVDDGDSSSTDEDSVSAVENAILKILLLQCIHMIPTFQKLRQIIHLFSLMEPIMEHLIML